MSDLSLKSQVIKMIKDGFTRPQISNKLGIKVGAIKHIAVTNGMVTHRKMTDEEKKRVNVMFNEGIPVSEIALIIGKSTSSINYYLDRSKKTSYRCDEVVRLHKLKVNNKSIAKFVGITETHVRMILRRRGLAKKRMTDDQIKQIVEMAQKGMRTKDIADIMSKPITTIQAYLRRNNLSRPVGNHNKPKKSTHKWDFPKKQRSI